MDFWRLFSSKGCSLLACVAFATAVVFPQLGAAAEAPSQETTPDGSNDKPPAAAPATTAAAVPASSTSALISTPPKSQLRWGPSVVPTNYTVTHWDKSHGLPRDSVRCITQARDGAIWIGTSEGFARFDGEQFQAYTRRTHRGLPTAATNVILEASDGGIWVGTNGSGLLRMDPKDGSLLKFVRKDGLLGVEILTLAEGSDGSIWVGSGSGLSRYKDATLKPYLGENNVLDSAIYGLMRSADGTVLLALRSGAFSFRDEKLTPIPLDTGTVTNMRMRTVFEEKSGALWIITNSEIVRREGGTYRRFTSGKGARPSAVNAIAQDLDGTIFMGTNDGLVKFVGDRFVPQAVPQLDPKEPIQALMADREGNIWIGTMSGLRCMRRTAFTALGASDGLPQATFYAMARDTGGTLWLATNNGLARIVGQELTVYGVPHGLRSDKIRSLAATRDGGILIGTDDPGIQLLRDGNLTSFPIVESTVNRSIESIYQDSQGRIWVSGRAGLWVMVNGQLEKRRSVQYENMRASSITEDPKGVVWIGTDHGLVRDSGGKYEVIRSEDGTGLPHNNIRSLYADADGVLWIGTNYAGLTWLKDGKFYRWQSRQGLPSDAVSAIIDDTHGYLWICTSQGITRVAKKQLLEFGNGTIRRPEFQTFSRLDGLRGSEVALGDPVVERMPDGRLWFVMPTSLATIDPARIPKNEAKPTVQITSVRLNDVELTERKGIVVPPGNNELEIGYTALSYAQPERIRYRYRLEGVNQRWVEAGSRKVAAFSRVRPGIRTFRVQAMNNDGVWGEDTARLELEFAPFFYETRWFYTSVGVGLIILAFGVHRLRLRALRRRERDLVKLVDERTAHLEAQISERKRAQEALARSEQLYESLVQVLPLSLYRKDREGRFTFANNHFCRLVGRSTEELAGKTDVDIYPAEMARKIRATDEHVMTQGKPIESEEVEPGANGERTWYHSLKVPVRNGAGEIVGVQGLAWDVTPRKRAEERAAQAQRDLVEMSRAAGMAEVATNVLHNVGNVLNSVNVSVSMAIERVRASRAANLARVAKTLEEHAGDMGTFMTTDPRGKAIPNYLQKLSENLLSDNEAVIGELNQLCKHVEHIKRVVAMQQGFARMVGITEPVSLVEVVEDAIGMNASGLVRHQVEIVRDFRDKPVTVSDRHKIMQMLVNLIENAKHACSAAEQPGRQVVVRLAREGELAVIRVIDNGVGIAPENLTRIFSHGFTTRKSGHGFGLHSSALIAKELGGQIRVQSAGVGQGAEFILELPIRTPAPDTEMAQSVEIPTPDTVGS